ncbi:TPA: hypothetical protein U2C55_001273 [Streptococcus suis]|nr:hypothetical protein [Streptococcus suis]
MTDYVHYNQERWNRVSARQGNAYTVPLSPEEFEKSKAKPPDRFPDGWKDGAA